MRDIGTRDSLREIDPLAEEMGGAALAGAAGLAAGAALGASAAGAALCAAGFGASAAGAALGASFGAAAGLGAAAPTSPALSLNKTSPTLTVSPALAFNSAMVPELGDRISTLTLSVSNTATTSSAWTVSPTAVDEHDQLILISM